MQVHLGYTEAGATLSSMQPSIDRRELEILFERCASLIFEFEAFRDSPEGAILRRPIGTGIFVAPCQAITARHNVMDMHRVNQGWTDDLIRDTSRYRVLPYHGSASQIMDIRNPGQFADWGFTNVWVNPVTDIAALQLAPTDSAAVEMMNRMRPLFPTWSLLPPSVGATVVLLGQPRDSAQADTSVSSTLTYTAQPAIVADIHERRLDRGMYNFPCFVVDREVPHGMSGGPVFHENRLCGIISGGLGAQTVVATLWPICLTEFENPKLGELNRKVTFESLFETGQLKAIDWKLVRGRVAYDDENGKPVPFLKTR